MGMNDKRHPWDFRLQRFGLKFRCQIKDPGQGLSVGFKAPGKDDFKRIGFDPAPSNGSRILTGRVILAGNRAGQSEEDQKKYDTSTINHLVSKSTFQESSSQVNPLSSSYSGVQLVFINQQI